MFRRAVNKKKDEVSISHLVLRSSIHIQSGAVVLLVGLSTQAGEDGLLGGLPLLWQ